MACKRTPESCDLVKIRENSLKIREKSVEICAKSVKTFAKSLKIWANSLKTRAKMAPNVLGFEKKWHSNLTKRVRRLQHYRSLRRIAAIREKAYALDCCAQ